MNQSESFSLKCPYCGGEYQRGYVVSRTQLMWIPEGKKHFAWVSHFTPKLLGAVPLQKNNNIRLDARFCPTCQKVELNVPQVTADAGEDGE